MDILSNQSFQDGAVPLTWGHLAMHWSAEPTAAGRATSPVAGDVFTYTLGSVTRFRLVPDSGLPTQDAFYSTFSAGVCSGLIVSRG
jgi:hypothetical protein